METEEEADMFFVTEESETSLEPFYEDDSPNEMQIETPTPPVLLREKSDVVKQSDVRVIPNKRDSSLSALVAATLNFGMFSSSLSQDSFDDTTEEQPPAVPPRPKMFPSQSTETNEGDQTENGEASDEEIDAGGEDSKEARKAFKKVG